MKRFLPSLTLLPAVLFAALLPALRAEEPVSEKAQRYYDSLIKRPVPGAVFDRFYTAWLESRTLDDLESWLKERADATDAPPAARLLLAYHFLRQGDNEKAIAAFRTATAADPKNAEAWLQQALAESRTLDFDSALASLDKAAAANPPAATLTKLKQLKGRLLARAGRVPDAVKVWQDLVAANPDDEDLQEDLVELQISEGLTNEALATAEALVARTADPYKKVQRRLRIGDIHQRAGAREKAVAVYLACLDDTGADSWLEKEILAQLEQTFRRDDAVDGLKEQYRSLVAKFPQRTSLRRRFAALLVETAATDEAIREYSDILAKTPGNREVRESFVDLLIQAQRPDDAATQMLELIRLYPQDLELIVKLADLRAAAGKKPEASAAVADFLAKSDKSEAAHLRAAGLLERYQLPTESLDLYKKAAATFPDSEGVQDALATVLHKSGAKDEAFAVWRKLAASPDKSRVMGVARSAAARDELAFAADLLTERLPEFSKDPLYLLQLCELAERTDREAQAVPWARTLVSLASDPVDLEATMTILLRLSEKAGQTEALLAQLKGNADSPQDKCLLAELLDRTGDPKGSEAALKEVEAAAPELAIAILVRLQSQRGDLAGAAASMKRLVESPSGRKSVHVQRLVELFERAGKLSDALTWIPEWKKLSPGSNLPWQKEASLQLAQGNNKEALRALRQASQEFDDNEDLKAMLAEAYRDDGKFADATRLYTVLYEEGKDLSAKIRWAGALAETARDADKLSELVEQFEERRKANRTSLLPLLALAEIHRVSENYEARAAALAEAARLKAGDLDILLEIARIAEAEGDFKRALETLREAEPLDKSGKVRQRIARVHFASGDEAKGMAALEQLASSVALDARQLESLADALCDQDLWKQAASFLEPRMKDFPGDYRLWYLCGCALEESDQPTPAATAFLHSLAIRDELPNRNAPGTPATVQPGSARDYTESLRPYVPADVLDIISLTYSSYQAYQYKNNRANRAAAGGNAPNLPAKVDESRSFSLVHLAALANEGEEATRTTIADGIRAAGISSADLLLELIQGTRVDRQINFAERLEKDPTNETILALAALWGNQQNSDPAVDLRVYSSLKEKRRELAWIAALRLIDDEDEAASKAWQESAAALEQLEVPPPILLNSLSSLLQNAQNPDAIPEANRVSLNRLRTKLPGWYRKSDPKGYQAPYIFIQLAGMLSREEDLKPLVALIEDEVAAHAADPQRSPKNFLSQMGGRPPLIETLTFPPQRLPDFSPLALMLLNARAENYYGNRMEWDSDKLKAALPAIKDPILKVLLTIRADDPDALSALLKSLTDPADAPLATLLLAAAHAAEENQWEAAGALLRRAQPMPMAREFRRLVDGSLVSWSIAASQAGGASIDKDSPLLAAGREALLRLRREASNAGQRQELADAMKELGMDSESERMAAAAQSGPQGPPSASVMSSAGAGISLRMINSGGRTSRIDQLVAKGKREDALRDLTRELKSMSKAWLAGNDSLRYQAREWVEAVNRHGFAQPLTAALNPGDNPSPDATAQFAAALDIMGEPRKALALYRKALEKKPKDAGLRKCLIMSALADDPEKAVEILKTEAPDQLLALSPNLVNVISTIETHAARFALLEVVLDALSKSDAPSLAKLNLDSLYQVFDYAMQQGWANRDQLDIGSLYQQTPSSYNGSDGEEANNRRKELQAQRLDLHNRFARRFMEIASTARRAFSRFAAVALKDGNESSNDELDKLAAAVLELERASRKTNGAIGSPIYNMGGRGDAIPLRQPGPEEWLLERAWKQNQPGKITDDLLPRLRAARATTARELEEMMPLYFCTADEFPAKALEFAAKRQKSVQPGQPQLHWQTVFHVADLRKLDADFGPLIVASLKNSNGNYYGGQEFWHIMQFAKRLIERKGPEAVDAFFREIAVIFLGPAEKRQEHFARHYNPRSYSSGSPNAMIMQWLNLMRTAWQSPELVFPAAECYIREFQRPARDVATDDQFFNYGNQLTDSAFFRQPAEKIVAFLRRTPMVRPLETFLPCAGPVNSQRCLALDVISGLSQAGPVRKALEEAFAKEPKTFGTELINAALTSDSSGNSGPAIRKLFVANLDAIRNLPDINRQDFAAMVKAMENRFGTSSDDKDAATLTAWADETLNGNADAMVAAFINPPAASKQPNARKPNPTGDSELASKLASLLPPVIKSKPADATAIVLRARQIVAENRRAGMQSQINYGDGSSVLGYLLANGLRTQRSSPNTQLPATDECLKSVRFYLDSTLAPEGFPIEWHPELLGILGSFANGACSQPSGKSDKPTERRFNADAMAAIAAAAGPNLPALAIPLAVSFAPGAITNDDEDRKFLAERAAASGPDQPVAALILAAEKFAAAKGNPLDEATAAPLLAILEPWLRNPAAPLSIRLACAGRLLATPCGSPAFRKALTEDLQTAWLQSSPVSETHAAAIISAFAATTGTDDAPLSDTDRAATDSLVKSWLRAATARGNPRGSFGYRGPQLEDNVVVRALVPLALRLGDDATLTKLLTTAGGMVDRAWFSKLVLSKRHDLARRILRSSGEELFANSSSESATWLPDGDATREEFLSGFDADDERFSASLLLASLPDDKRITEGDLKYLAPTLSTRLKALAAKMPATFRNPLLLERSLGILLDDKEAALLVSEPLAAWAAQQTLGTLSQVEDSTQRSRRVKLYSTNLSAELEKGSLDAFCSAMEQIGANASSRQGGYISEAITAIYPACDKASPALWKAADEPGRARIRKAWREISLVEESQNLVEANLGRRLVRSMLQHAADNHMDEFAAEANAAPKRARSGFTAALGALNLAEDLKAIAASWPDLVKASGLSRTTLVLRILDNGIAWPGPDKPEFPWFRTLIDAKWLDRDELLAAAPTLITTHPRDGRTAMELAVLMAEAGKPDDALAALDKAAAALPADSPSAKVLVTLTRAEILERSDKPADALAALQSLAESTLGEKSVPAGSKNRVNTLRTQLEQQLAFAKGGLTEALRAAAAAVTADSDKPENWRATLAALRTAATAQSRAKDHAAAVHSLSMAWSVARKLGAREPNAEAAATLKSISDALKEARTAANDPLAPITLVSDATEWLASPDGTTITEADAINPDFDVSSWSPVTGPVGWGNGQSINSKIKPQPVRWLRFRFKADPDKVQKIFYRLTADDGAALWLNGLKFARNNLNGDSLQPLRPISSSRNTRSTPSTSSSSPFKPESLKADNVLTVALCQHPAGLSSGFLSLAIIGNDSNDPTDLGATINAKTTAAALGDAWAQFPESFRKTIEED